MDKTFNISVRDRLAKNLSHLDYVCGNTGYIVRFDFDEEWDAYPIKTAHFIESSGEHHNATVIDNQCEFPQIMNTIRVEVGVYAGDLCTTTPAVIGARRSILSTGGDRPAMPEKNEYDKMMEAINQDAVRAETAAKKAEEKLADMQERYYTPSVSEDGDLSWEANDEEMPDVPTVNIKGVPGDPGKPGDDGYSPSVNINPIDGGHRVTVTDANGAKTFDVMNGEPGEPGVNAENDELFVVRRVNTYSADKTYEEIETAIAQRRVVMLVDGGTVFHYIRTDSDGIVFSRYYESTSNKYPGIWESRATINKNNVLSVKTFSPAKTPNPRKLILTGAVNAEYDGSEAVTVEIPAGGEDGGTGLPTGGKPHQMLVTDAEGNAKWEERTHYVESGTVEYLSECEGIFVDEGMFAITKPFNHDFVFGETYTVYWNDVAYETVCKEFVENEGGPSAPGFGDIDLLMGTGSTGEPFFIGLAPNGVEGNMEITAMVFAIDGSTSVTLKIEGEGEVVHQLDPKYLPDEVAPATPITLTLAADGTFTSDTSFETAYEKDELTLARSIRVVCPAGVDVGDNELNTESYYAASNVSKGIGYLGNAYIRCEFAAFVELSENDQAPAKFELIWSNDAGISFWLELPQLPVVSVNRTKNSTLHYYAQGKRWRVNPNHTVDWDGNGWFAGTVEGTALILTSPDGSRWQITVDNTGALATAKL